MDSRSPFPPDFRLYLASRSPRRRELLQGLEVPFSVVSSAADEILEGEAPARLAERNAGAKAHAAVLPPEAPCGAFVLGTDTVVVVDKQVLGKPTDRAAAQAMLRLLAGRSHQVISGVALVRLGAGGRAAAVASGSAVTRVDVAPLADEDVAAYLASGEWRDKAGAYAIQGLAALFITGIEGEYANVVGLPVRLVSRLFRELGFDLLRREWQPRG